MEQFVRATSNSDFVLRLQQLISGDNNIQREIIDALRPISDFINQLYNEVSNIFCNFQIKNSLIRRDNSVISL